MTSVRYPAVAGLFYPDDPVELSEVVRRFISAETPRGPIPKAIVAPHAGYVYSGPVAASAYRLLTPAKNTISRVILAGPAHHVPFRGLAIPSVDTFLSPLGRVPVDRPSVAKISELPFVKRHDGPHEPEHSLEVHLPFLQKILGEFTVIPILVGDATGEEVATVLEQLWEKDTLIVISSDLSHYHDYPTAKHLDAATSKAIEHLDPSRITFESACGRIPLNGMLLTARKHGLKAETLDLRNSGDTAGPKDRVVGYGAYAFF
ncbi:MAG: AmmeMemoRadiSam system protein B [Methylohalobius crimeensis]